MLSRIANSVYWMSRYIERAENVARFIHVNFNLLLDYPDLGDERQWSPLITTSGDHKDFENRYGKASEKNVIQFLSFDTKNPNSILSCLYAARENGQAVRDILPTELWEHLNNFYLMVRMRSREKEAWDIQSFYNEVKSACHLFMGTADVVMCREEAWSFGRVGHLIERADKTSRILDVRNFVSLSPLEKTSFDSIFLGAILKSASAFEMYQTHFHHIFYKNVVEFLIFEKTFPRSLVYCIKEIESIQEKIFEKGEESLSTKIDELIKMMTNVDDIFEEGVHNFINRFQTKLNELGDKIQTTLF